jgi:hypothetical protein
MLGYPTPEAQVGSRLTRLRRVAGAEVLVAEVDGQVAGLVAICPTQLFERWRWIRMEFGAIARLITRTDKAFVAAVGGAAAGVGRPSRSRAT